MVKIPSKLEDLVPPAAFGKILDMLNQPALAGAVREALNRVGLKDASPLDQVQEAWQQARDWVGQFANRFAHGGGGNPQVINATGELIRADSSGLPMSPSVADAYASQAVSFHERAQLDEACHRAAADAVGAEEAVCTSSLAAAIHTICSALSNCVVSRADMVRVPGFGDMRAMLTWRGQLTEVGATNGASLDDWSNAVHSAEQAIILVSPTSLSSSEADAQRTAAIAVAKSTGAAVIEVMLDGICSASLQDSPFPLPSIKSHLESGATAVIFPLDGFLSGPSGACMAGRAKLINRLLPLVSTQSSNLRGPAIAAATAAFDRAKMITPLDTGIVDLVTGNIANLRDRGKRLAIQMADTERVTAAIVVERDVPLGPSPWNRYVGTSIAVALTPRSDVQSLVANLRNRIAGPAIHCASTENTLLIDLRFVLPKDDHQVVQALTANVPARESPIETGTGAAQGA